MYQQPAGSPPTGEPAFLVIGKLRHPHGVRGEILMEVITDFPERLKVGSQVYVGAEYRPERIRTIRAHGKGLLISFEAYQTPESVGVLRNQLVFTPSTNLPPLPEGEYYHHQLIGLRVLSDQSQELGHLAEILSTHANDVYIIRRPDGTELLLPAIESVILKIDLQQREILVHLLPGME
ncbi:MAG: ribosome maturation factor RimM [Anaerolineales bacterium]|nr:ribosome maturation factor RimM [Anaerolineales bacterium]